MGHGYNGKILVVDLTNGTHQVNEPDESWYRTYWGGTGIIAQTLLEEATHEVDPLGAEHVLIFACSVVTGAPISGFNRYSVGAKSPLTGGFARTEAAGFFGPELKFAGFDAIIIRGAAKKPVYLWINDGAVEIRDASGLWGLDNWETLESLRELTSEAKVRLARY